MRKFSKILIAICAILGATFLVPNFALALEITSGGIYTTSDQLVHTVPSGLIGYVLTGPFSAGPFPCSLATSYSLDGVSTTQNNNLSSTGSVVLALPSLSAGAHTFSAKYSFSYTCSGSYGTATITETTPSISFTVAPLPSCTYSCPAGNTPISSGANMTCQAPAYQPTGSAAIITPTITNAWWVCTVLKSGQFWATDPVTAYPGNPNLSWPTRSWVEANLKPVGGITQGFTPCIETANVASCPPGNILSGSTCLPPLITPTPTTAISSCTTAAPTGTIVVSSNVSSSWTITGPATITGSGTSQTSLSQPTGTYTITWDPVAGYTTPVSQSLTLSSGGTINFSGTYSLTPTGTWTAPTCPTACGSAASTLLYSCVGGNGLCSINTPATLSCVATAACNTGTWAYPVSCPTACGIAQSTQTQVCMGGNGSCAGLAVSRTCGATAACTIGGICGTANGTPTATTPTTNLCSYSSVSPTVGGVGPWSWTCMGLNGGSNATCSASKIPTVIKTKYQQF